MSERFSQTGKAQHAPRVNRGPGARSQNQTAAAHAALLALQRQAGNQAVAHLLGKPVPPVVQRVPLVKSIATGEQEDAGLWTYDVIDKYLDDYDKLPSFNRGDRTQDANAVRALKDGQKYQDEKRQAEDPIGYAFDTSKTTFKRDDEKIKRANALIDAFDQADHSNDFLQPNLKTMVDELKKAVADPSYMDQKKYPICGADTYLRMYAVHNPEAYVGLVISLFQTGKGTLGQQTIKIPSSVEEKHLAATKMHITEWVATASLRIGTNKLYKSVTRSGPGWNFPKNWHAGLAGMSSVGDVEKWFRSAGVPKSGIVTASYLVTKTPSSVITTINNEFTSGHAVALMINYDIVDNKLDHSINKSILYRHCVMLSSDFQLISKNYLANCMTWGGQKQMTFKQGQLSRAILGFVAVDMSSLDNPAAASSGTADASGHDSATTSSGTSSEGEHT